MKLDRLRLMINRAAGLENTGFFSEVMRRILHQAKKYHEDRSIPVLIEGETGTGKEVIAKIMHFGQLEKQAPFIDVNCAALTANLFESELFGYESGAFTGGLTKGQKGKFDLAEGGSLLLDEVGEIPLELQGKLLRVIQEKEFYRVGGLKKIKTDVRIICATNANLAERVEQGTFRKDLFFRLKVGHIAIPPLRERREEIAPLTEIFLRQFTAQKGKRFREISDSAIELLLAYDWPGNVRELRNTIELTTFMYDDVELKPNHLCHLNRGSLAPAVIPGGYQVLNPEKFILPTGGFDLEEYVDRIVEQALALCRGNKTAAARYLRISRRSLYCRLQRKK